MSDSLESMRHSYERAALADCDLNADPLVQFQAWFEETRAADIREPNAMTLATVDSQGRPSARIVLLRGVDARGFRFFTNYESRKGFEMAANPRVALLFYWDRLERQVRIEGDVHRLGAAESDEYFETRPRGHRLSAWASRQSRVVSSRETLEIAMREAETRFTEGVPRPPYWGGYRVEPSRFEFWQGRRDRVHDRIGYERIDAGWSISRLSP